MSVDPEAREALSYVHEVPGHCDRIVWRGLYYGLPPTAVVVQTEGPEWEAMVLRAAQAVNGDSISTTTGMLDITARMLRAALTPKQETPDGGDG
jgi:hypothetical protein